MTAGALPGWESLAREAARGRDPASAAVRAQRLLRFDLAGTPYAVPVDRVREIVRMRALTPIPRAPAAVRGVISLRGQILQVVDLGLRLGLAARPPDPASRIVVAHDGDGRVAGLLVDAVAEVLPVAEQALCPVPPGDSRAVEALFLQNDRFVSLVDLDRILDPDAAC